MVFTFKVNIRGNENLSPKHIREPELREWSVEIIRER